MGLLAVPAKGQGARYVSGVAGVAASTMDYQLSTNSAEAEVDRKGNGRGAEGKLIELRALQKWSRKKKWSTKLHVPLRGTIFRPEKHSLKRYEAVQVESCVSFILSPRFVGYLSWGIKHLCIDERRFPFPRLSRTMLPSRIFELYKDWCKA